MMTHDDSTNGIINRPMEFLGTLLLLIIGGNDTTRNSISGGVVALNENPDEYQKLRDEPRADSEHGVGNHPLADAAFSYASYRQGRYRTGRSADQKGDKVVMWYLSGNRDADAIDRPDEFIIDRPNARHHLSFGFGIHRCMGNRLAEMQLRVVWEEIQKRFRRVELVGDPVRTPFQFCPRLFAGARAGPRPVAMEASGNLKMKDLEARTGLSRQAIHFYLREGLLPEPHRPKRNVAHYSEEHVARIKLIKRLQEEKFLPLGVIKNMLADADTPRRGCGGRSGGLSS